MNIFFDVDETLISWDARLRPDVHEVLSALITDGHTIYLWSGYGPRWEVVERFGLHPYVTDCFWKPLYNHVARLEELGVPLVPDYVIDDYASVVAAFSGTTVTPAIAPFTDDNEMRRVYDEIQAFLVRRERAADGQTAEA